MDGQQAVARDGLPPRENGGVGSKKMELYPKRKTDEEYVEFTRRLIKRSRWFGLLFALGAVFFLVLFEVLLHLIYSMDGGLGEVSDGLHVGIMLGAIEGIFILIGVQNIIWATQYFKGQRTERLMVKFHDELEIKNKTSNQASDATSEPAPGAVSSAREG